MGLVSVRVDFFFGHGSTEDYENLSCELIMFSLGIMFALLTGFSLADFRVHRVLGQK